MSTGSALRCSESLIVYTGKRGQKQQWVIQRYNILQLPKNHGHVKLIEEILSCRCHSYIGQSPWVQFAMYFQIQPHYTVKIFNSPDVITILLCHLFEAHKANFQLSIMEVCLQLLELTVRCEAHIEDVSSI